MVEMTMEWPDLMVDNYRGDLIILLEINWREELWNGDDKTKKKIKWFLGLTSEILYPIRPYVTEYCGTTKGESESFLRFQERVEIIKWKDQKIHGRYHWRNDKGLIQSMWGRSPGNVKHDGDG